MGDWATRIPTATQSFTGSGCALNPHSIHCGTLQELQKPSRNPSFWQDFQQWLPKEDIIQKSVLWQVHGVYFTERHVQVHWVESHCTILLLRLPVESLVRHWSPGHCQKGLHYTPLQETVSWVEAREKSTNAVDHNGWKAMPCCCHAQEQALSARPGPVCAISRAPSPRQKGDWSPFYQGDGPCPGRARHTPAGHPGMSLRGLRTP